MHTTGVSHEIPCSAASFLIHHSCSLTEASHGAPASRCQGTIHLHPCPGIYTKVNSMNLRRDFRSQQPESDKYPQHFPSLHLTLLSPYWSLSLHLSQPIKVLTTIYPETVPLGLSLFTLWTKLPSSLNLFLFPLLAITLLSLHSQSILSTEAKVLL